MRLLECIRDSREKGKKGLCVLSSPKKMPYLSDTGYLKYKGFQVADTAEPYFELLYFPFDKKELVPCFRPQVKSPHIEEDGVVLYYTHQCPFTAKYVPLIEETARENKIPFRSILIDSGEKARNAPSAATSYALFYNGKFVTHEILSVKKFNSMEFRTSCDDKSDIRKER